MFLGVVSLSPRLVAAAAQSSSVSIKLEPAGQVPIVLRMKPLLSHSEPEETSERMTKCSAAYQGERPAAWGVERERGEWERRLKDEERDMERRKGETELLVYKLEDAEGRKEMAERREEEVRKEMGGLVEKVRSEARRVED